MAEKEGARFSAYLNQAHFFVIVYESTEELSQRVSDTMDDYLSSKHPNERLITGNLIFKDGKSLLLVNKFETKDSAWSFYESFQEQNAVIDLIEREYRPRENASKPSGAGGGE